MGLLKKIVGNPYKLDEEDIFNTVLAGFSGVAPLDGISLGLMNVFPEAYSVLQYRNVDNHGNWHHGVFGRDEVYEGKDSKSAKRARELAFDEYSIDDDVFNKVSLPPHMREKFKGIFDSKLAYRKAFRFSLDNNSALTTTRLHESSIPDCGRLVSIGFNTAINCGNLVGVEGPCALGFMLPLNDLGKIENTMNQLQSLNNHAQLVYGLNEVNNSHQMLSVNMGEDLITPLSSSTAAPALTQMLHQIGTMWGWNLGDYYESQSGTGKGYPFNGMAIGVVNNGSSLGSLFRKKRTPLQLDGNALCAELGIPISQFPQLETGEKMRGDSGPVAIDAEIITR